MHVIEGDLKFNSLRLIFFGKQQPTIGLDKEGDLMRFNTHEHNLYKV